MSKQAGITFMEIVIVIAILGIVSAIAIPNLIGWFPQHRLGVATRDMITTLQRARIQAIKDNTDIIVDVNVGNDTYTVFQDDGAGSPDADNNGIPDNALNWVRDGSERIYNTDPLPAGINIIAADFGGGASSVRFTPRGFPLNAAGNSTAGRVTFRNSRSTTQVVLLDISGNAR